MTKLDDCLCLKKPISKVRTNWVKIIVSGAGMKDQCGGFVDSWSSMRE